MNDFLSIIVVSDGSTSELGRTLFSLSPRFQDGVSADEYEVIVVDNGPSPTLRSGDHDELGLDLRILPTPEPELDLGRALNLGLDSSIGAAVGVMFDGASLASRRLIRRSREALQTAPRAVVGTRVRRLEPSDQSRATHTRSSDSALSSSDWERNGDELFRVSVFDDESGPTWFGAVSRTDTLFAPREIWKELRGVDDSLGSTVLTGRDTWTRACQRPGVTPIVLLGDATFLQRPGSRPAPDAGQVVPAHRSALATPSVSYWGSLDIPIRDGELVVSPDRAGSPDADVMSRRGGSLRRVIDRRLSGPATSRVED